METDIPESCPRCGNRTDETGYWYAVEQGERWGTCWECGEPTPLRAEVSRLRSEVERLRGSLAEAVPAVEGYGQHESYEEWRRWSKWDDGATVEWADAWLSDARALLASTTPAAPPRGTPPTRAGLDRAFEAARDPGRKWDDDPAPREAGETPAHPTPPEPELPSGATDETEKRQVQECESGCSVHTHALVYGPDGEDVHVWDETDVDPGVRVTANDATPELLAYALHRAGLLPSGLTPTWDLGEDVLQTIGREGNTVDVGWYPDGDPAGGFVCRVVRDRDWENPLEEYRTADPIDVLGWLEAKTAKPGVPGHSGLTPEQRRDLANALSSRNKIKSKE